MKEVILIISDRKLSPPIVDKFIKLLSRRLDGISIIYGSLDDDEELDLVAASFLSENTSRIIIQPLDISYDGRKLEKLQSRIRLYSHGKIDISLLEPLLDDIGIIDLFEKRIRKTMPVMNEYHEVPPQEIQEKSFSLIDASLSLFREDEEKRKIVIRAIHATADFSIADSFYFSHDALVRGKEAIKRKMPIITDVNMIATGIGSLFRDRVLCVVADRRAKQLAESHGLTRSAAAFELLKNRFNGAIAVVGNAPTALVHLLRMIERDSVKPALIIGVPVGFVGAAESKELLIQSGYPCISLRGNRGGSTIAAAIVNALGSL